MNTFMNSLAGTAWSIVPVLLIFFLLSGILFVFYYKAKTEEKMRYLKSIAESLAKLSNQNGSDHYPFKKL